MEKQPNATYLPDALELPLFKVLGQISIQFNKEIFVIGGYARDYLLGKECKDIDIVAVGSGIEVAEVFAKEIGVENVITYQNFGTALVRVGDYNVEFVGARKESYRSNSRKPIVENGSLLEDQLRRDFTINALSLNLNPNNWGELIDPFGGVADLVSGILKTPNNPDVTFSDDPLRMLRAVRFATTLGFKIEEKTYQALSTNKERIKIVSAERIVEELNKMLMATQPSIGFKLLFNTGLLDIIFPEFAHLQGVDIMNGQAHKDNFYHTLKVVDNICQTTDNLWLRWAAMLHDIAKPATKRYDPKIGWTFWGHEELGARMTPKIFQKLKLPTNEKMKYVQKLVRLHLRPISLVDEEVTDSAIRRLIVDAGEDLEDLMKLCRADITTRDEAKMDKYLANYKYVEKKIEEVMERDRLRNWQPPITGQIIMETFDLQPGKEIGIIKDMVRNAIMDGIIPNEYEAAFDYMLKVGNKLLKG